MLVMKVVTDMVPGYTLSTHNQRTLMNISSPKYDGMAAISSRMPWLILMLLAVWYEIRNLM